MRPEGEPKDIKISLYDAGDAGKQGQIGHIHPPRDEGNVTMSLPILLVPGLNCTPEVWGPQISGLWQRGPVTVADTRGGASMAEIAAAILRNAPPRFVLAGISMGGYLSFEIWRQAPERVLGIGFVDTSARPDAPEATERRRAAMALASEGRFGLVVSKAFSLAVHEAHVDRDDLKAIHTRMSLAVGVETYFRQQEAIIARPDSRPTLATIDVPTTVIVGEGDRLTPPELSAEIAAGIAGAELVTVPDAGHMSPLENPDAVTAALGRLVDRVAAR
jgi:pimeloyl-ACP methyl ester carboxylesterase